MRFVRHLRNCEDDLSAPSSVQSVDSYDLFGSACSDYSECELEERRSRRLRHKSHSALTLTPSSYHSAMERVEATPLLTASSSSYSTMNDQQVTKFPADPPPPDIISVYKKQEKTKSQGKKQSSLVTIFSVWNTIMGSSLLTIAWGVERAGLPAALLLVAVMAALCLYTAYLLLKVNARHGSDSCEVPALCGMLLGGWAEVVAHVFSVCVLLGANIVYWTLITNFLYFTVNYLRDVNTMNGTSYNSSLLCPKHGGVNGSLLIPEPTEESPAWALHSTVPIYVAIIVFPLLNFRNVSFFTKFNSLGTLSVVYLLIFVMVKGFAWGINISSVSVETHAGRDAAVLSGMLTLSFYIHNIIISVMSNNERQDKNGRDLTIAFVLVTLTYTLVGAVFYICFPLAKSCIEDNILNNFEIHDIMTAVARVLLLFQVITVYPLVAYMLRTEAILLLPLSEDWKLRRGTIIIINITIVIICILFACFFPSIGTTIRYTGAVSGLAHIFALPSLLQMRSLQLRGKLTWWKATFFITIMALGLVNLFMQFFITE